jgi:hypothetical protein
MTIGYCGPQGDSAGSGKSRRAKTCMLLPAPEGLNKVAVRYSTLAGRGIDKIVGNVQAAVRRKQVDPDGSSAPQANVDRVL